MRRNIAVLLCAFHQLALAVWLGGILTIGVVVAPAVFGSAKQAGDTQLGTPLYDFAASAMSVVFSRFNYLVLAAGGLMLVTGWGYGSLAGLCRGRVAVRAALTLAAWSVGLWLTFGLFPAMTAARAAGEMAAFDRMHHLYTHAFQAQLLLLLAVLALTGWLHLDRASRSAAEPERARHEAPVLGEAL